MEIHDVDENLNAELVSFYRGEKDGFVQVGDKKWFYPKKFRILADELKNFEVRSDDIWITGYPRSGTTLTEELCWLISHNLDYVKAKKIPLGTRVRFFESNIVINETTVKEVVDKFPSEEKQFRNMRNTLNELKDAKERRVIKTHLPFELLPPDVIRKGCKIIYVCRYPKDVSVSYFCLQSSSRHIDFCGDFQKYWSYFRNGKCMFGPYFEHVKQGFDRIGSENFMFVFYEDFRKNRRGYITKLSEFLENPLNENDLDKLENYIDFDNFRKTAKIQVKNKNNEVMSFIRRGKVDGWKDYFTEEMNKEADPWIQMNTERIGIRFAQQKE
ncbi:sulfotransferase 1C4-like [Harmonia axyridis]|uniref:sulfotransferase 1C4-like n=1 Tax=Harmonia axyridis TaxID=115357 RepID=UPI001E2750DD|nr:sulfotransferase 1C4-like [Harmonia axyridis]